MFKIRTSPLPSNPCLRRNQKKNEPSDINKNPEDTQNSNTDEKASPPPVRLPTEVAQLKHIFGDNDGHLPDTPENRQLLEDVANDKDTVLGPDRFGNVWNGRIRPDGKQIWTTTRKGIIQNGGLNDVPRKYNPLTGLSRRNLDGRSLTPWRLHMSVLTHEQAYEAMFHFLENFYNQTGSDVGALLGSMSLLVDGGTADPAMAKHWQRAVEFALNGGKASLLEIIPVTRK